MTAAPRDLARPVLLIYWLTLAGGLALFAATRSDDAGATAALVIGALGGTLLGHALALRNVRFWLAALTVTAAAIYTGPLIPEGIAATRLWQAFIPAALCAFWSLGDRSGLVAAWFPAVIWMLSILDRAGLALAPDGTAAILLAGLAALFIGFLHARETRRVGLWRSVAAAPIAAPRDLELLRQPPARHLARAAWWLSVAAITAAIMVWLVPPLWQRESLGGATLQITEPTFAGLRCCPSHADTGSVRIKEYLGLGLGHDEHATPPREGVDCRVCDAPPRAASDTVAADSANPAERGASPDAVSGGNGSPDVIGRAAPVDSRVGAAPAGRSTPSPSPATPSPNPATPSPNPATLSPIARDAAPPAVTADARRVTADAPRVAATGSPTAPQRGLGNAAGPSLLGWLARAVIAAVLLQLVRLVLRPLRRLVTLRHLRQPFWAETVDQRVSNAWQLALIGLRDAGWRAGASEAPRELARRVGVDGVDRCAAILERARHGFGLDAGDLAEMQISADAAYRAARHDIGGIARALGWLRWPLS